MKNFLVKIMFLILKDGGNYFKVNKVTVFKDTHTGEDYLIIEKDKRIIEKIFYDL